MSHNREDLFKELFKAKDEIKSEIHKTKTIKEDYINYGLINTDWYKDYLHFLWKAKSKSNNKLKENLFKYKYIHPKNDDRDYSYTEIGGFNFPSDFVFVTEKFMNLISDYFYQSEKNKVKSYLFKVAIGGECIIMRDKHEENTENMYIIIYEENKGNINNNIDFILKIYDYNNFKKICNFILQNNLWIFFKKIDFSEKEDEKEIRNDNGVKIGYICRNGELERIKEIKLMQQMKSFDNTATKKIIPKINSILMGLYLSNIFVQEISKFYQDNKNKITKMFVEYFQNYKIDNINSTFYKSINIDIFEYIFDEIFEKLDLELSNENENKELNGENDRLKEFKEQYKKGSIIKRLFYCPQEINKYCTSCEKTLHKYKYKKIILIKSIDTKTENFLSEKILKSEDIQIEEQCKLCHVKSNCVKSKKSISFPMILIIVIKEDQIGKLNIKKEIKNDEGISYQLFCLIEAKENMVYYKNEFGFWLRCGDNKQEDIESKVPIVLFYRLVKIKNKVAINNNINNQLANNHININNHNLMINSMNNINMNNYNVKKTHENYMNINKASNKEKINLNNFSNMNNNNNMNKNYTNMNNPNDMERYNFNNMNDVNMMNGMNNPNENYINMNNVNNMNSNNVNNMNNNNMIYMNRNILNMNRNSNNSNYMSNINMNNININSGYEYNINQINNMENQPIDLNRQIFELRKENERLRYELEKEKIINNNLEEKMKKKLNEKDEEITKLKLRYPFELSEGEKLISITFISIDELIQYSIICKNTHKFREIENMFYYKYIEYKNKNIRFLIKGKSVNPSKTLEENNIKNGDVILFKVNK